MNPNTRVSVHCYEGDGHQVRDALHLYTHHECPLTIISPEDSQVVIPGVECRFAGKRDGSVLTVQIPGEPVERIITGGQLANDRQVAQLKLLLTYPEEWFLMNDADSFCLSPQIPRYLYNRPDTIWCGVANDPNEPAYVGANLPADFPRFALQPPYFTHRNVIERMLLTTPTYDERFPWIDHFMMHMAYLAQVRFVNFDDGYGADLDRYPENLPPAVRAVRYQGKVFIHSSKCKTSWGPLVEARAGYCADQRRIRA